MCGILAVIGHLPEHGVDLDAAIAALKARGPESYGINHPDGNNASLHFQRLAIQGVSGSSGMQPFHENKITWMCNGEIYNARELTTSLGKIYDNNSSDCAVIGELYKTFGIERCVQMLDGVFGLAIYDTTDCSRTTVHVARDPFGVRPLYMLQGNGWSVVASDVKSLSPLALNGTNIIQVPPGSYVTFECIGGHWRTKNPVRYFNLRYSPEVFHPSGIKHDHIDELTHRMVDALVNAVFKRVSTVERPVACLLSGGLDSSLIAALVSRMYMGKLRTYCIGMPGSPDAKSASIVAKHLGIDDHKCIVVSQEKFFRAIPEVVAAVESYDTTTVRASVGNYLVANYIATISDVKVVFNGDGSDEVTGGYIYISEAGTDVKFDDECRRLLENISCFDVLRSDRSIASNGLEARTPFLDRTFVDYYLAIPAMYRYHKSKTPIADAYWLAVENELIRKGDTFVAECVRKRPEKLLLRYAIYRWLPGLLPAEVLWRSKEAFSDGVSSEGESWYEVINRMLTDVELPDTVECENNHLVPTTKEQLYYRHIFNSLYPRAQLTIPYFWMPRWCNTTDPSARTLKSYGK